MKRVNGMLLHDLGRYVNRLDSISQSSTYREIRVDCLAGITAIKGFIFDGEFADMFDLCRKPAQELIGILKRISDTREKDMDKEISPPMYGDLRNKLQDFNRFLDSEIQNGSLFLAMEKKGYDTKKLLNQGEVMFHNRLGHICPRAISDVREGMKCLLFELFTAAAFHFHRANETVVKEYAKSKGVSLKKTHRTLGNYPVPLSKAGAPVQITRDLKRIADELRNPLVHEDHVIVDLDEINVIYKDLSIVIDKMIDDMAGNFNPP